MRRASAIRNLMRRMSRDEAIRTYDESLEKKRRRIASQVVKDGVVWRRKRSPEQEQTICREYKEGTSYKVLSERYAVPVRTIHKMLKRNGVAIHDPTPKTTEVKKKLSASVKAYFAANPRGPVSEETRKRMSESRSALLARTPMTEERRRKFSEAARRGAEKRGVRSNTGIRHIFWDKYNERFVVRIGCNGGYVTVGRFETLEEAKSALDAYRASQGTGTTRIAS